jgi:hypothetical protein
MNPRIQIPIPPKNEIAERNVLFNSFQVVLVNSEDNTPRKNI